MESSFCMGNNTVKYIIEIRDKASLLHVTTEIDISFFTEFSYNRPGNYFVLNYAEYTFTVQKTFKYYF